MPFALYPAHVEAQLDPVLKEFVLLGDCLKEFDSKGNCVSDINGKDARKTEKELLDSPQDVSKQNKLLTLTTDMAARCALKPCFSDSPKEAE